MRKVSFIYMPLLFLLYISTETYLKLNHSSLCHSRGCELAGGLLNIPPIWLNYIGIVSSLLLLFLGYLTYIRAFSKRYFFIYLSSMILFETIMIGYQYFASPEFCKFCLGVYGSLLTIALFTMKEKLFYLLPAIIAPLVALYLLAIPKSQSYVVENKNYLIQSQTCPHCKKVKEFLKKENIEFIKLDAKSIEARNFVKYLGFKTIPMLVVKKNNRIEIINGDEDIINYFSHTSAPSDILSTTPKSDGCEISVFEQESCDKK